MVGRQRDPQARGAGRYGRRPDRGHPEAGAVECRGEREGCFVAADHERLHGGLRVDRLPRRGREHRARARDEMAQMRAPALALVARDQREARTDRMRDRRRRGSREDIGPRTLDQPFDHGRMRDHERARDTRGLAERADVDQVLGTQSCRRERAAALCAEHAETVCVVDDEPGLAPLGDREQRAERRDVAVHAEHAVGRDHAPLSAGMARARRRIGRGRGARSGVARRSGPGGRRRSGPGGRRQSGSRGGRQSGSRGQLRPGSRGPFRPGPRRPLRADSRGRRRGGDLVGRDQRVERRRVAVRIDPHLGAREPRAVDQRGMVEAVRIDRRAVAAERRHDGEIRHIAGREVERARAVDETAAERGELRLERGMRGAVSAEQMRAAAARAELRGAFGERGDERRVRGEPEIVVARETDDLAAVDAHPRGAPRLDGLAPPREPLRRELGETLVQVVQQVHIDYRSSAMTCSKVARVRHASRSMSASART